MKRAAFWRDSMIGDGNVRCLTAGRLGPSDVFWSPDFGFCQFYGFVDYDQVLWTKTWLAIAGDSHYLCVCFGSAFLMICLGVDYVLASRVFS